LSILMVHGTRVSRRRRLSMGMKSGLGWVVWG
jgi:hypothetical protein